MIDRISLSRSQKYVGSNMMVDGSVMSECKRGSTKEKEAEGYTYTYFGLVFNVWVWFSHGLIQIHFFGEKVKNCTT